MKMRRGKKIPDQLLKSSKPQDTVFMSEFNYTDIWWITNIAEHGSSKTSLNYIEDKLMIQKPQYPTGGKDILDFYK